jgi:hypothetical protein
MSEALKKEGAKPITITRTDGTIDVVSQAGFFQKTIPVEPEPKPEPKNPKVGRPKKPLEYQPKPLPDHRELFVPTEYKVHPDIFIPTRHNKPEPKKPIIKLGGVQILTFQNVSVLIAQQGYGKSSVCEAILSKVLDKDCDALGFELGDVNKCVYIDCERTEEDVYYSYERMNKRARVNPDEEPEKVVITGFRMIAKVNERRTAIETFIKIHKPELVLIDGSGDLVTDTNSLEQAVELKVWLRYLTSKYKLSIFTTLHPNKGTDIARGHLGSELLREAESVFVLKKKGEIRTITTDFSHGKNRNAGEAFASFMWNDEAGMMISTDTPDETPNKLRSPYEILTPEQIVEMLISTLKEEKVLYRDLILKTKAHLQTNYRDKVKTGDNEIKTFVSTLQEKEYIVKSTDARYPLYSISKKYLKQTKLL